MKPFLLALSLLAAQSPYIETFEVRVQNVDVVVTDRAGKPVSGLTRNDFVVLEDGVPQEISNFAAYDESAGTLRAGAEEAPPVAVAPPPRTVVFFIDEMALHPVSRGKLVRNAVELFEAMPAHDRAMVVTATGETQVVQEATSDRAAVRRALETVIGSMNKPGATQAASEVRYFEMLIRMSSSNDEVRNARRRYSSLVRRRVMQRLGTLRAVVASVSALPGKKILVLVSSAIEAKPGAEESWQEQFERVSAFSGQGASGGGNTASGGGSTSGGFGASAPTGFANSSAPLSTVSGVGFDLQPLIADLGRTAAANGITIYPLQPDAPLELLAPGSVENRRGTRVRSGGHWAMVVANNELTMTSLAETTGGRWFRGDGRIDDLFRQVASDVRSYYSLAYHMREPNERVRRIEVRVKNRPELTVRTRRDAVETSTDVEMTDLTMAATLYTHPVNELAITAVAGTPKARRDVVTIPVEVRIPMEKLTFLPVADGRYSATFFVYYAASGEKRDFIAGEKREQKVEISETQRRELAGKTFRFSTELMVTPGLYRIGVGVFDATSRLSGFDAITVNAK